MKLCLVRFVVVVLIHSNHNLNERILGVFLCIDITGIFATRHQFVDDSLILIAIRIIYNVIDNLTVANDAKSPKYHKDRHFGTNKGRVDADDASHMIQLATHIQARRLRGQIGRVAH